MVKILYIKRNDNPTLYKKSSKIESSSNQRSFRINYLQEFMKQQFAMNHELKHSSNKVNQLLSESNLIQQKQFINVIKQIELQEKRTNPLLDNVQKQEEVYHSLLQRIDKLDHANNKLLEKQRDEGFINQAIIDQLTIQDTTIQQLTKKLDQIEKMNDRLTEQLTEHKVINDTIMNTLEIQETFHQTILERVDGQEAINQKISRDMDSLKASLFERINYVVEKIEENYKFLTGFIFKLFNKTGETQSFISTDREKKKKEKITSK